MKSLWSLIARGSVKDLLKYKSFFLLILLLFVLDRVLKHLLPLDHSSLPLPDFKQLLSRFEQEAPATAYYIFLVFPERLIDFLLRPLTLVAGLGLFFFKQLISLWPSSDMRRMHRKEREAFGLLHSLQELGWSQVAWDACAVLWILGFAAFWVIISFYLALALWGGINAFLGLGALALLLAAVAPIVMTAFSFSSKLAVIRRGSFSQKFRLYLLLFWSFRLFASSYLFFSFRVFFELLFVLLIPLGLLIYVDNYLLKMTLSALSATPVYSFLKMASFKFFLWLYRGFPLVQAEYAQYYKEAKLDLN